MGQGAGGGKSNLDAVVALLTAGRSVLLGGGAGSGKSHLADRVAQAGEAAGWYVVSVRGTTGSSEIPLGAFASHVGAEGRPLTPLLTEIRESIAERASGRTTLLVVDDVNLLDDASAALMHQIAVAGEARLLVTLRDQELPPVEVDELLRRGLLELYALQPLTMDEMPALAATLDERPLSTRALADLHRVSRGNPLIARELLRSALDEGRLVATPYGVDITDLPVKAPRLAELVRLRLSVLSDSDRDVLIHLAFAEPCGPGELATVTDLGTLGRLETAGFIEAREDGRRIVLGVAHPLYSAVLRSSSGPMQRRAVHAALAESLRRTGARRRSDVLRLARLAVDGGGEVDAKVLVTATRQALDAGDLVLAERIGRRAFDADPSWRAGWDLGRTLLVSGDLDGARAHIDALGQRAESARERLSTAYLAAEAEFWLAGDVDAALTRERSVDDALLIDDGTAPITAQEFPLAMSMFRAVQGRLDEAITVTEPAMSLDAGPALIRAAHAGAHALLLAARPAAALAACEVAVDRFSEVGAWAAPISRRAVLLHASAAKSYGGRPVDGLADAVEMLGSAPNSSHYVAGAFSRAIAELFVGRPRTAAWHLSVASTRWRAIAGGGLPVRWLLALTAAASAKAGDQPAARHALAEFDAHPHPAVSLDVYADIARARLLVDDGYLEAARTLFRDRSVHYRTTGQRAAELHCLYELVRLGNAAEVADAMVTAGDVADGEMFAAWVDHALASRAGSVEQLDAAGERLATAGYSEFAADAITEASETARRAGRQRDANRLFHRANELRAMCEVASAITVPLNVGPIALSRREREVALLAAQGLANKEIAERLYISFRTCENHLARVYDKVGVRTRAELARAFDGGIARLAG